MGVERILHLVYSRSKLLESSEFPSFHSLPLYPHCAFLTPRPRRGRPSHQNISLLRQDGRLILLALLSGGTLPASSSFGPILFKRLTIKGSTLRSRTTEYQGELLQRFEEEALGMIGGEGEGRLKVKVHEVFPWDKVVEAHKEMEANKNSGKVSLMVVRFPDVEESYG
jgi:hypothetical protein